MDWESYLDFDYIPSKIPHREKEIAEIIDSFKPLEENRKPKNIFIHGPSGIGKTLSVKYAMKYFDIPTIYVNSWFFRTEVSILAEILRQLNIPTPKKGISVDELIQELLSVLNRTSILVAIDEIDVANSSIFYTLSRLPNIGLILIANKEYSILRLDERARSSLSLYNLEFKPYSIEQIKDIIMERCKNVFNSCNKDAINLLARATFARNSDIRFALSILLEFGRRFGIESFDLRVASIIKNFISLSKKHELEGEKKKIYDILKMLAKPTSSTELYKKYVEKGGKLAERTFRKYIKEMIDENYLEIVNLKGRERILKIKD